MSRKQRIGYVLSVGLLLGCVLAAVGLGAIELSPGKMVGIVQAQLGFDPWFSFSDLEANVLLEVRLPRVLTAVVIGAGLACAGAAMQGVFRNPLVDASLIGISAGASLFASLFILFNSVVPWFSWFSKGLTLSCVAFAGASITAMLVVRMAYFQGKLNTAALILGGVAINAIAGAGTGLLTYFADDNELRDLTFWTLGSLGNSTWEKWMILVPFILIPLVLIQTKANELNALTLGESAAAYMGVPIRKTKLILILATTCMVGAGVAFTGIIGFVGLVVPHIVRLTVGPNHRLLLPISAILGACLLTLSDLIARTLLSPTEIPIGIVTALIGSPFFVTMILKNKRTLLA